MKEWECAEVKHHKNVGRTIEEWQKNGWRLHTYTCAGPYGSVGGAVNHYLLFERENDKKMPSSAKAAAAAAAAAAT